MNLKTSRKATVTLHGKRKIASAMYVRGKNFAEAGHLLRKKGGYEYVALHLLCQGIEIILKGLLLLSNYDIYYPKLPGEYGHDLIKLADAAEDEFGVSALNPAERDQLKDLNRLYKKHVLRYASLLDILVKPSTVRSDLIWRKTKAVVRLTDCRMGNAGSI